MNEIKKKDSMAEMLLGLVLFAISIVLGLFTTAYLWNNIMAYLFSLPVLTWAQAFAVDLFVTYLAVPIRESNDKSVLEISVLTIQRTLVFLVLGWITIQFI